MQCAPNTCMRKNCMALLFEGRYRVEYWSDCGAFVELHQHRNHITSLSPCRHNKPLAANKNYSVAISETSPGPPEVPPRSSPIIVSLAVLKSPNLTFRNVSVGGMRPKLFRFCYSAQTRQCVTNGWGTGTNTTLHTMASNEHPRRFPAYHSRPLRLNEELRNLRDKPEFRYSSKIDINS